MKMSPIDSNWGCWWGPCPENWTGQGRMPKAIAAAVAGGKVLEEFLI